jgi:tight adherence protein C
MPVLVVVAALAVVLSLPLLWYSLAVGRVSASRRRVSRNLNAGLAESGDLRRLVLSQSPLERIAQPLIRALGRPARRLSPGAVVAGVERHLEVAGVSWPLERVLLLKLGLAGFLLVGGLVRSPMADPGPALLLALVAGVAGYLIPDVVLARMAASRQLTIGNQLPDLLDQLTICVESGLGFDAALARTSKSGRGPLAQEIGRVLQDLRVGVPRSEALDGLLSRTDVPELRQFVHAIMQAETYGVPVSKVLRSQAVEQREKRKFRAEERAMKLPVKVIFPLVFCIMPVLFIVVIGPAYVHLSSGLG